MMIEEVSGKTMPSNESYEAMVEKVIPEGPHGPYGVARSEKLDGSITFSLNKPVWQEIYPPDSGTIVILSQIRKKRAGWRANYARFVTPDDVTKSKLGGWYK